MKELDLNKESDLIALKESFSKKIDNQINTVKINEALSNLDNANFGELKQVFESLSNRIYETSNGKKLISKYVKLMKENKDMNHLYNIYLAIDKPVQVNNCNLSSLAINEACSKINKKDLNNGLSKLRNIVRDVVLESKIDADTLNETLNQNKKLNESVNYLANHSSKTNSNLNESIKHLEVITNEIAKKEPQQISESTNKTQKELVNDLNTLLESSDLNEWESKTIQDISLYDMAGKDKSELFEEYKNICINTIDNLCEDKTPEENARFFSMKQQLMEKKYNSENIIEDLLTLSELNETLLNQ